MPIYQSHVGAPEYERNALAFKPFDLAGAVERGMQAATQMTIAQQNIAQNQQELAIQSALVPVKIAEAKSRVALMESERRANELVNAPERIKAKMDFEDAQRGLEMRKMRDQTSLMDHASDLVELERYSRTNPGQFLAKRDGLALVMGGNLAFQEALSKLDSQFDQADFVGADMVSAKGAYIRAHAKDATTFRSLAGLSGAEYADMKYKTARDARINEAIAQKIPAEVIAKREEAIEAEIKAKAVNDTIAAQTFIEIQDIKSKLSAEKAKNQTQFESSALIAPGLRKSDISKTGNVGDKDLAVMAIGGLNSMETELNKLANVRPDIADRISEKLDKIRLLRKHLSSVGANWYSAPTDLARDKVRSFVWIPDIATGVEGWFSGVNTAAEMKEFYAIKDLASAGKQEEAFNRLNKWVWDFSLTKTQAQLEKQLELKEASLALPTNDIPLQSVTVPTK